MSFHAPVVFTPKQSSLCSGLLRAWTPNGAPPEHERPIFGACTAAGRLRQAVSCGSVQDLEGFLLVVKDNDVYKNYMHNISPSYHMYTGNATQATLLPV